MVENVSTGQIDYADMVNGARAGWVNVVTLPGFNVVAVGDINDDHYADIVLENNSTGQIEYANMNNGVFNGLVNVATLAGFNVLGVGDIQFDGFADIIVENQSTGQIEYANMNNGVFNGWVNVSTKPGFNVVGVGDITGSGFDSIVIQNPTTGTIDYSNMTGGSFNGWVKIKNTPGWNVVAVEDVVGNGFADVVIENPTTGQIGYADMTGGVFSGWGSFINLPMGFNAGSAIGPAVGLPVQPATSYSASANSPAANVAMATNVSWLAENSIGGSTSNTGAIGFGDAGENINTPQASSSENRTLAVDPDQLNNGGMPPVGTWIHFPLFDAWLDGSSSSDGGTQLSNSTPNLPIGVWEATHYANTGNSEASPSSFSGEISASWLTDGAASGGAPESAFSQPVSTSANSLGIPMNDLQHALQLSAHS